MTVIDGGGGDAVPFIIPPPTSGDERMDASGAAKFAWDIVAVFGPLTRSESLRYMPSEAWAEREYKRWTGKAASSSGAADRWAWNRTLDQAVDKGWIVEVDGQLTAGEIPPDHQPLGRLEMRDISSWATREIVRPDDLFDAVKFLMSAKWREIRRKPKPAKRAALKASIERIGVLYPALVWSMPMTNKEIVIDGVTRQEIVAEINAERPAAQQIVMPDPIHLTSRSAYEAVLARIEAELSGTSKDQSPEELDKYLVKLESLGLSHALIASFVGMTRAAVSNRLARAKELKRTPPPKRDPRDHTEEFVRLRDEGYYQVDIAGKTGWSQKSVSRVLREYDEQRAAQAVGATPDVMPEDDLEWRTMETAVFDLPDRFTAHDIGYRNENEARNGRRRLSKLTSKGLLKQVGKDGQKPVYEVTPLGRELTPARQVTEEPEPEAAECNHSCPLHCCN